MTQPLPTVTIGIPTHEASQSLIATLMSIYKQSSLSQVEEILLIGDGKKISNEIRKKIHHKKLRIIEFDTQMGQARRINDILNNSKSDFTILTNDDVLWDKDCLTHLIKDYSVKHTDLISGHVLPLSPRFLIEKIVAIPSLITYETVKKWNNADNYLAINGRLIGLSRKLRSKIRIPDNLWNNDAYIYFKAKELGCIFSFSDKSLCFYKVPSVLSEYVSQSDKFHESKYENKSYFSLNISNFYQIPSSAKLLPVVYIFLKKPIYTFLYILLLLCTRISSPLRKRFTKKKNFWKTDISTKNI